MILILIQSILLSNFSHSRCFKPDLQVCNHNAHGDRIPLEINALMKIVSSISSRFSFCLSLSQPSIYVNTNIFIHIYSQLINPYSFLSGFLFPRSSPLLSRCFDRSIRHRKSIIFLPNTSSLSINLVLHTYSSFIERHALCISR